MSEVKRLTVEQPYIHINRTRHSIFRLDRSHCPTCERRTFFAAFFQDWYGWDSTCLRCGERWQDGEMCERPFLRGWRKKSIEDTKRHYRRLKAQEAQAV